MDHINCAGELLQRLEQFCFDRYDDSASLSRRLANEHGWSREYAGRVLREYKRFAFLAVVAGHRVTPSDHVDQAWHLHLIYSESYWRFCGEVLRQPLHHRPAAGRRSDRARYKAAYERTLVSYRQLFLEAPPADIWPEPDRRFDETHGWVRVSSRRHWIVRKPAWWPAIAWPRTRAWLRSCKTSRGTASGLASIVAGAASAAACAGRFEFTDYQFSITYLVVWVSSLIVASCVRYRWRRPQGLMMVTSPVLDAYEVAYLAGGARLAIDAAVASLAQRQMVDIDQEGKLVCGTARPDDLHPVERAVCDGLVGPCDQSDVNRLRSPRSNELKSIADRLEQLGLLAVNTSRRRWLPAAIAIVAPVAAVAALVGSPVRISWLGVMPLLCVITVVVTLGVFHPPDRTAFGDRLLKELRAKHRALLKLSQHPLPRDQFDAVPLGVGLFGLSVLVGSSHGLLGNWLAMDPPLGDRCGHGCD